MWPTALMPERERRWPAQVSVMLTTATVMGPRAPTVFSLLHAQVPQRDMAHSALTACPLLKRQCILTGTVSACLVQAGLQNLCSLICCTIACAALQLPKATWISLACRAYIMLRDALAPRLSEGALASARCILSGHDQRDHGMIES